MGLKLSELTTKTICAWLESEVPSRPTSAAYAFRMLKAFVRWCEGHDKYAGIAAANCCTSPKVTGILPRNNTKDGDSLQREQLAVWFAAVRGLPNPVQSAYLQGLLITGARREELAALRWEDVDFQWRSLHIADKIETEAGRVIPLTPYLASLLLNLKHLNETPPSTRRLRTLEARGKSGSRRPGYSVASTPKRVTLQSHDMRTTRLPKRQASRISPYMACAGRLARYRNGSKYR